MTRKVIDLRCDTITRPVPEMRQVMANAEVGMMSLVMIQL